MRLRHPKLPRILGRDPDPYWHSFTNAPPSDPNNMVTSSLRNLPEGRVFPVKSELHSPDVTSSQIKELANFLGASDCAILRLKTSDADERLGLPFAVVCVLRAEHDPKQALGIGGQASAITAAFLSYLLGAYIRELGKRGTRVVNDNGERLAVAAGLGVLGGRGRLRDGPLGPHLYVADVIRTDLPLAADVEVVSPWPPTS